MNARWSERYRAKLNEPPPHAPDYVLLSSFELTRPGTNRENTVAILHNESLGTYLWRRSVLEGKIHGKFAWLDCLTIYRSLGDVIADIAKTYYDEAVRSAKLTAMIEQ